MIQLTLIDYAIALPFIFLAGLVDAIAGGGGLISLPAYLERGDSAASCFGNQQIFLLFWLPFFPRQTISGQK